jgi:hypothetical protein
VPCSFPLKAVSEKGGIAEAAIELQLDAALGNIENEFAERAVVVLPAALVLLQVVVAKRFDPVAKSALDAVKLAGTPGGLLQFDRNLRNLL